MSDHLGENLSSLPGLKTFFSPEHVKKLNEYWIETPQQVLSAAATPEGFERVAQLLELDQGQLDQIVSKIAASMPEKEAKTLQQPRPGGAMGVRWKTDESSSESSESKSDS